MLNYREELDVVTAFLINSGYEDIIITDDDGMMLADLQDLPIEDEAVLSAIDRLFGKGLYLQIFKNGNTIDLLQWTGLKDIGCGIAYTTDPESLPEVQYCTELIPISDDGWFYYVSNYELWRLNKTTS